MTINKTGEWVALIGGVVAVIGVAATVVLWLLAIRIEEATATEVASQLLNLDDPKDAPAFVTMQADVANLQEGQARLIEVNDKIYDKLLEISERNASR